MHSIRAADAVGKRYGTSNTTKEETMAKMLLPDRSLVTPRSVPATVLFDGTRWSKAVVRGALLTVTLCQTVHAAPGDLDPSFDADGKVLTDFRGSSTASAVVVQPDGKLVAAGRPRFLLARYRPDGSLDRRFGRRGLVETGFGASAFANALTLQPDGKLVAAVDWTRATGQKAISLWRVTI